MASAHFFGALLKAPAKCKNFLLVLNAMNENPRKIRSLNKALKKILMSSSAISKTKLFQTKTDF